MRTCKCRCIVKLAYKLVPAEEDLYSDLVLKNLKNVQKSEKAGVNYFSNPLFTEMSTNGLTKYITILDKSTNGKTLYDLMEANFKNPQMENYFIKAKRSKELYAYIAVQKSNSSSIDGISVFPLSSKALNNYGIYGKSGVLQECLHEILENFQSGSWFTHTKDKAVDDYRNVVSRLEGITIDVSGVSYFVYDRSTAISGSSAILMAMQLINHAQTQIGSV